VLGVGLLGLVTLANLRGLRESASLFSVPVYLYQHHIEVPLEVVDSPFRDLTRPVLDYLDRLVAEQPGTVVTVVISELVVHRWWEQVLHNHAALALKIRLHFRRDTIVVSVPSQVD
jgi:hypothetical protein